MSASKSNNSRPPDVSESVQSDLLTLAGQMMDLSEKQRKSILVFFAGLLRPYGIPPTPLHEVLQEATIRAGWILPSAKAKRHQQAAAKARKIQREEDLAHRRVLVSHIFKQLRPGLQKRPGSLGTAQAVIGRLEKLTFKRTLPITVRTIQEDIRFLRKNGNFGI
jgi:hypothetical protein